MGSHIFRSLGDQKIPVCSDLKKARFFTDIVKFNQLCQFISDDLYKADA